MARLAAAEVVSALIGAPLSDQLETFLPDLDVPLQDARDMAAYLHTPD